MVTRLWIFTYSLVIDIAPNHMTWLSTIDMTPSHMTCFLLYIIKQRQNGKSHIFHWVHCQHFQVKNNPLCERFFLNLLAAQLLRNTLAWKTYMLFPKWWCTFNTIHLFKTQKSDDWKRFIYMNISVSVCDIRCDCLI